MKNLVLTLIGVSSLLISSAVVASGYSTQIGNTTYHNFGGTSGYSTQIGNTTYHKVGSTSGYSTQIGNTTYHHFNN